MVLSWNYIIRVQYFGSKLTVRYFDLQAFLILIASEIIVLQLMCLHEL